MAKFRKDNPEGTPLDPFAFEKTMGVVRSNNPYVRPSNNLEINLEAPIEEGYSSLGNSIYAQKAINEYKYNEQGWGETLAKGIGRTLSKAGTEVLKVPGYIGGGVAAVGNEVFGDGKNSMSLMVDNGWINAFESMDEELKSLMPVHIGQQVQEGNLLDKMASGAWWATTGADGLGFMLSMIAPGAALKLARTGKALGSVAEVLANSRGGKILSANKFLGLSSEVEGLSETFKVGQAWTRNADGITAALLNTSIEAAAEGAGIYDNTMKELKPKIQSGEITEEFAKQLAGEKASSVFKSNMSLLLVSNLLEQAWVWKAFGSNADSVIGKAFKDGKLDLDTLKQMGNRSFKESLKDYGTGILKNIGKEGFLEEGVQSQIEQRVEKGKNDGFAGSLLAGEELLKNIVTGSDDFWKNTELHEAMFLGSVLGGGMGIVGQIKENNNLDRYLNGFSKANESNAWYNKLLRKSGLKQSPEDSQGLIGLLEDNYIKNFKSDLSAVQTNGVLDSNKMYALWEQGKTEEFIQARYDAAVASGDKVATEKNGLLLAQHYVQPFLGQKGMDEIFQQHVENELTPVWEQRFQQSYGRPATEQEVKQFQKDFTNSGKNVFDAFREAERTNYPENYIKQTSNDPVKYGEFRRKYFNGKLQTILEFQSLNNVETLVKEEFRKSGLQSKIEMIDDLNYKVVGSIDARESKEIQDYFKTLKEIDKQRQDTSSKYDLFFNKKEVQSLYDNVTKTEPVNVEQELEQDNENKRKEQQKIEKELAEKERKIKEEEEKRVQAYQNSQNNIPVSVPIRTPKGKVNVQSNEIGEIVNVDTKEVLTPEEVYNSEITNDSETTSVFEDVVDDTNVVEPVIDETTPIEDVQETKELEDLFEEPISVVTEPDEKQTEYIDSELGFLPLTDKHTSGRNVEYNLTNRYDDIIDENGLPVLGTENQQLWFNYLDNMNLGQHSLLIAPLIQIKDKYPNIYSQILEDGSGQELRETDLYSVILKDREIVELPKEGKTKYLVQSIQRPETIYNPNNTRVAKKFIDSFEGNDKFGQAKREYEKWYSSFTQPTEVEITDISNGFPLIKRDKNNEIVWGKLTFKQMEDTSNNLIVAYTDNISTRHGIKKVKKGDLVLENKYGVYPLRMVNLSYSEVESIIDMLKMIQPTVEQTRLVSADVRTSLGTKKIGVFYDKNTVPLFKRLFYMQKGKEGSMWINSGMASITYHPFGKNPVILPLSEIDNNSDFRDFLSNKRKPFNNLLKDTGYIYQNSQKEFIESNETYSNVILSEVTSPFHEAPNYPKRLQKYLSIGNTTGLPVPSTNKVNTKNYTIILNLFSKNKFELKDSGDFKMKMIDTNVGEVIFNNDNLEQIYSMIDSYRNVVLLKGIGKPPLNAKIIPGVVRWENGVFNVEKMITLEWENNSLSRKERANKAKNILDSDKVFTIDELLQIKINTGEIIKNCK